MTSHNSEVASPRILAVDDSAYQAARLEAVLLAHGFDVALARNGEQGLALLAAGSFDVVISDVVMPGMTGFEFCRRIKASDPETPVLLLTSLSEPTDIIHGLESGADNFLTKPYDPDRLVARINAILANRRVRGHSDESDVVDLVFHGSRFAIRSGKRQILDLLISNFEDTLHANAELRRNQAELSSAQAELQRYAAELEDRVRGRTAELARANADLQAEMAAHKQAQERLVHAQKMEAIGNLTGGMAHDFNNLLGVIIGNIDALREPSRSQGEIEELALEALTAAVHGAELTRGLLAFSRRQPLRLVAVDVNSVVSGTAKLLGRTLGENITIKLDLTSGVWPTVADPVQLEAGLTNLATNARDAMPKGGSLRVATSNRSLLDEAQMDLGPGDYVVIQVSDTGTGMPPEVLDRIFDPFFTTKQPGQGTGLGLSMLFGYVKQCRGHITVESEVGHGTTFRLYLPRAQDTIAEERALPKARATLGSGETVLVVEDNEGLRRVVARQLRQLNYRVLEAADAAGAFDFLEREAIDILLTDVVIPGAISGLDIARTVAQRSPRTAIIVTSGYPNAGTNEEAMPTVVQLPKPYRKEDLARVLREALGD